MHIRKAVDFFSAISASTINSRQGPELDWSIRIDLGVVPLNRRLFNKSVIHRAFEATAFYGNSNSH
jgi:hypothetical protein